MTNIDMVFIKGYNMARMRIEKYVHLGEDIDGRNKGSISIVVEAEDDNLNAYTIMPAVRATFEDLVAGKSLDERIKEEEANGSATEAEASAIEAPDTTIPKAKPVQKKAVKKPHNGMYA